MPTRDEILADPLFKQAAPDTQREILTNNDPVFAAASKVAQDEILAGVNKGFWTKAKERIEEALPPFLGGTIGAVGGFAVGGPPGAILFGGLGAGGGLALDQYFTKGSVSMPDVAAETLLSMGGEVGGRIIRGAGGIVRDALRVGPRSDAAEVLQAFRAIGVEPKITDVAGTRLPAVLEQAMGQTLTGQRAIRETVEGQARRVSEAAREFTDRLGGQQGQSAAMTGEALTRRIEANARHFRALEDQVFAALDDRARDLTVNIAGMKPFARSVLGHEAAMLEGQPNAVLIRQMEDILARPDEVPWRVVRAWQRGWGRTIGHESGMIADTPIAEAKLFFRESMNAMEQAAAASGRIDVQHAFTQARGFAEQGLSLFKDSSLSKVLNMDPEQVVRLLDPRGGPTAIRRAKTAILGDPALGFAHNPDPADVDAWNLFRRHVMEGVFEQARDRSAKGFLGEIISGTKLGTQVRKIGDETLGELLMPGERQALNNITKVAEAIRASEKYAAVGFTSSTPQGLGVQGALLGIGASIGKMIGVDPTVAATLTYLTAPPLIAKVLTNPRAAEIIASPAFDGVIRGLRLGGRIGAEGTQLLTRLSGVLAGQSEQARGAARAVLGIAPGREESSETPPPAPLLPPTASRATDLRAP